MKSFLLKSSPEPEISVKSVVEFDAISKSEYDILMENQFHADNRSVSELKTEVLLKSEPEADVWVRKEPEADVWVKSEPKADVFVKSEPEADIEIKMELENDLETEFEFGVGKKLDSSMVRIFKVSS